MLDQYLILDKTDLPKAQIYSFMSRSLFVFGGCGRDKMLMIIFCLFNILLLSPPPNRNEEQRDQKEILKHSNDRYITIFIVHFLWKRLSVREKRLENFVFYKVKMHVEKTLKCHLFLPCFQSSHVGQTGKMRET